MRQDFGFRALTYNVHLFGRSMAGISDIVDILSGLGVMDSLTFHDEERLEEIIWGIIGNVRSSTITEISVVA